MKEIFKDIPHYEGYYQISNLGRVKSLARTITRVDGFKRRVSEFILTPSSIGEGNWARPTVPLRKDNKTELVPVVRAMLSAFYPEYEIGTHKIEYKDNDPFNVNLSNVKFDYWDGRYGGRVTITPKGAKRSKHFRSINEAARVMKFDHARLVDSYLDGEEYIKDLTIEFDRPFVYKKETIQKIKV